MKPIDIRSFRFAAASSGENIGESYLLVAQSREALSALFEKCAHEKIKPDMIYEVGFNQCCLAPVDLDLSADRWREVQEAKDEFREQKEEREQ